MNALCSKFLEGLEKEGKSKVFLINFPTLTTTIPEFYLRFQGGGRGEGGGAV